MADELTADERAAIEAALNAGKVQRIPRGESGLPLPVYDEKTGYLRTPHYDLKRLACRSKKRKPRKKPDQTWRKQRSEAIAERRRNVRSLRAEGLSITQIAARLGTPKTTIKNDYAWMFGHKRKAA